MFFGIHPNHPWETRTSKTAEYIYVAEMRSSCVNKENVKYTKKILLDFLFQRHLVRRCKKLQYNCLMCSCFERFFGTVKVTVNVVCNSHLIHLTICSLQWKPHSPPKSFCIFWSYLILGNIFWATHAVSAFCEIVKTIFREPKANKLGKCGTI